MRDHPRSRGVYCAHAPSRVGCTGSSPLARGLRSRRLSVFRRWRIIPARAGFTRHRRPSGRSWRDHPRSRGVYLAGVDDDQAPGGSSPLARGLRGGWLIMSSDMGIIPARAGFTLDKGVGLLPSRDHPRSRGVYAYDKGAMDVRQGSSPLARGLLWDAACDAEHRRIIPARAGFTSGGDAGEYLRTDHPRSRGVYV